MADDPLREYGHLFHEYANLFPLMTDEELEDGGKWWRMRCWRARRDSNSRPSDSKSDALSS